MSGNLPVTGNPALKFRNVLVHTQCSHVLQGVLLDHAILRGLIQTFPDFHGGGRITCMLGHGGSHYFHPGQSLRMLGAFLKGLLGSFVVFAVEVMNESKSKVETPIIGIGANPFFHQGHGLIRLACAFRRLLRKKHRTKFIGHDQVRVKIGGDVQQRIKQIVAQGFFMVFLAEILDSTGPVDIGKQS